MKKYIFILLMPLMLFTQCHQSVSNQKQKGVFYDETWESLATCNREPEWFKDAKFGIYFHWGVYSVPAFGSEWYPRWMYCPDRGNNWGAEVFKHHAETYGPATEFNYHNFVPMFKAEHFDANDWADLFKESGAKFAGLVAEHHDGFAMWNSKINPWNAKEMGPKQDILGLLFSKLKKLDMKTIATFHHARNLQRYANDSANWAGKGPDVGWNSHYLYHPKYATSSTDSMLRLLYGNIPENQFYNNWLNQVNEVVDNYAPDIIWFDSWLDLIPEIYRKKMVAHHFNAAVSRNQEPIVCYKQNDLPANVGVLDIEQGGKTDISEDYWLTDITISYGSWCYTNGQTYKDLATIIRNMIDVWSKKGIVLLNISPRADGVIPDEQRVILKSIGDWISRHQEAVYKTRPYSIFGYGNADIEAGHFGGQSATINYGKDDFRFTTSIDKKNLFVYELGMPEPNAKIELQHVFDTANPKAIKRISLVGNDTDLKWLVSGDTLILETPEASDMDEIATVFKIEFK
jgi:alpha-L-fucosidase